MRSAAPDTTRASRVRRRAVLTILSLVAGLAPALASATSAQAAVASGGASARRWVAFQPYAVDWTGDIIAGWGPGRDSAVRLYNVTGFPWNSNGGRVRHIKTLANNGFLYTGNGGSDGPQPRTLMINNPDPVYGPRGQVSNNEFMLNYCDYNGLTYRDGRADAPFNAAKQTFSAADTWKKNPWWYADPVRYKGWSTWQAVGGPGTSFYYWVSPYYDLDSSPTDNGNLWFNGGTRAWWNACERNATQRQLSYDTAPQGAFDSVTNTGTGEITVSAWGGDRDSFAATPLRVTIDGVVVSNRNPTVARADARTALNNAFDPASKRFTDTYGISNRYTGIKSGMRNVCVWVDNKLPSDSPIDGAAAADKNLGCKQVRVNTPPIARPDQVSTWRTTPVTVNVLANDTDPDGDALRVTRVVTQGQHGTATVSGSSIIYRPNGTSRDVWDTVTYEIADAYGAVATSVVQVWVDRHLGANPGPTVRPDSVGVYMRTTTPINVLANDSAPYAGGTMYLQGLVAAPTKGSANPAGSALYYTPSWHYADTDRMSYRACYANTEYLPELACNDGQVTVNVINRAPTAGNFTISVDPGKTLAVPFDAHVADPDGDAVGVSIVAQPAVGKLTYNAGTSTYSFTAPLQFQASSTTFTYVATDAFGGRSAVRTVTVELPYVVRPA